MGEIYTKSEAASLGGGTSTSNECVTKSEAIAFGCVVNGSFANNELVDNLSAPAPTVVTIHIVEICVDAPYNYWGTCTTSVGVTFESAGCKILDPNPVIVPAGASMSARISGGNVDDEVGGIVPTDITEGNYRWNISFQSGTMSFEYM